MRKLWSVILSAALTAALLTGCASSEKPSDTKETPTKEAAQTTPEATKEITPEVTKEASPLPETLANGNITILWHTSEEQYKKNLADDPNTFDAVWSVKDAFEEKYGGKVTVISTEWGTQKEQLISMVNGGEVVDLAQAHDQNFPIYPAKNIVQEITKYVDTKDDFWYDGVTNAFTYGEKQYAVGTDATPVVLYYNKTLFENYGEKTPREYYEEGNWTWDNFRNAAIAMTGDTDGDGVNDTFGFGWWDSSYVQFLASNGITHINYQPQDGSAISSNYTTKQAEEAITFLQNGYVKDKYIDTTQDGDYFINQFKSGKLAMTCEYGFNGYNAYNCEYEVEWAPFPTGPSGKTNQGGGGLSGWCIPITAANGEGAAVFMRMASQMQLDFNNDANIVKFGQENVDLMNTLASSIVFAPIGIEKYWDANWTIYQGMINATPVSTFLTTAHEQILEGAAITLEQ